MDKLHYRGDHRKFVPNRIIGPDCWGAWYLPISAHYFDGVTTIYYKPVPRDQLPPQAALMSKQIVAQQQQRNGKQVMQWQPESVSSPPTKSPNSLVLSPISRRSGTRKSKGGSAGTALTKSQRELLKRFRRPG